jgi:hypothetical protein
MWYGRKRIIGLCAGLFITVLFCSGCIKVTLTNPADGATGVARDAVIRVTFDLPAQPKSVNAGTFLVEDSLGNPVTGTVTYADKVATFTPGSDLVMLRGYTVTLTRGIKNFLGFAMASNYSFDFTTCDGTWGTAALIETDNAGNAYYPQIAIDTAGNALAVWYQSDGTLLNIWANRYTAGTGWGTAALIETDNSGSAYDPQIAIDAAGNALAVWDQTNGTRSNIWANRYTAGTGWGTAELIETDNTGNAYFPQIAFDTAGNALAVWHQSEGTRFNIWANRYTAGSGWGTAELIETDNAGIAYYPQIAIDAAGNALAVWQQSDGTRYNIWANRYTAGSGWGKAAMIETDNAGDAWSPQIAFDAEGNALAVWYQSDGTRLNIWANRYTAGTGWGAAALIETDNAGDAWSPQIACDAAGNALAVWEQSDGTRYNIWANRYTAGAGWGTAELIETDNAGIAYYPQIAFDATGNALAVWEQSDGTRHNIWTNRYTAGAGWGAASLIETDNAGGAYKPQIACNAAGNALAVWWQSDGTRNNIWANHLE